MPVHHLSSCLIAFDHKGTALALIDAVLTVTMPEGPLIGAPEATEEATLAGTEEAIVGRVGIGVPMAAIEDMMAKIGAVGNGQ